MSENGVSIERENQQLKELVVTLDRKAKAVKLQIQQASDTVTRLFLFVIELDKLVTKLENQNTGE